MRALCNVPCIGCAVPALVAPCIAVGALHCLHAVLHSAFAPKEDLQVLFGACRVVCSDCLCKVGSPMTLDRRRAWLETGSRRERIKVFVFLHFAVGITFMPNAAAHVR